jgi:hypothetical protein
MKMIYWLVIVVGLSASLALVGCGKKQAAVQQQQGMGADLPKLKEAFASAGPEVQANVTEVLQGARYGEYGRALTALDKLAATPNLTEDQKALVGRVSTEMKQFAGKGALPPAR